MFKKVKKTDFLWGKRATYSEKARNTMMLSLAGLRCVALYTPNHIAL